MRSTVLSLAVAALAASPALAAETYTIDKNHSEASFQVRHLGISNVRGRFEDFDGAIEIDRAKPEASSVSFTIQAASINTNTPDRDKHLRSADFFDVANHPTLTFKSTAVKPNGKDSFLVTGDLTMRGVTKQVSLPVTLLGEGKDPMGNDKIGFETGVTLNRTEFGLNWNRALEGGGTLLSDDVKIQIAVEANKAKPPAPAN
jgi:polyisoprenoid-binding protein YceI